MRQRKTRDIWVVQQYTSQGWEDVNAEETRQDGKRSVKEYRDNQPEYPARLVKRREKIEAHPYWGTLGPAIFGE